MFYICENLLNLTSENWALNVIANVNLKVSVEMIELQITGNNEKLIINGIFNCWNLKKLDCSNSNFTGISFKIKSDMFINLEYLYLSNCELFDEVNLKVPFHKLKVFGCRNTNITGSCFKSIAENLEELDCQECSKIDKNYLIRFNFPELKSINCSSTNITGRCFVNKFDKLEEIYCWRCSSNFGEFVRINRITIHNEWYHYWR